MALSLVTERLLLRDLLEEDWPAVHAYAAQPEVYRFQPWDPSTPEAARAFIAQAQATAGLQPRTDYALAIVCKACNTVIGACLLNVLNQAFGSAEIGYFLHPAYWKQGYATETARRLLAFGFEDLQLHRIVGQCDPRNRDSVRVLERIGMQYEGRLRETMLLRDGWRDSLLYSILEHEWPAPPGAR